MPPFALAGIATGSTRTVVGGEFSTEMNFDCTTSTTPIFAAANSVISSSITDAACSGVGLSPISGRSLRNVRPIYLKKPTPFLPMPISSTV